LFQDPVELIIETNASRKGWGVYCEGVRTGGPWSFEEKRLHINCLELLAGSLAIKTFTKSRACAHLKLLMDNASAVAYINKMGGTHSQGLAKLAIDLWEWCFQKDMMVSAQHLPGYLNVRADQKSRVIQDSSDWKLNLSVFQALLNRWKLSANPMKQQTFQKKLETFCWRPGDKTPVVPMPLPGVSGLAGVINEKLIHFQHL
jgi:hypothetical protein